ncbi:MAG: hypothetical protein WCV50_06265 [Patescibacteria group bacterium]|jgi:hypothetical protein
MKPSKSKLEVALKWIVNILIKHNVPYQISGGFGVHLYGGTRPVNDIDIDIPNKKFKDILSEINKYITFGPARYLDEKWDLDLITLDYHGQIIDLSGSFGAKIFDERKKVWQSFPSNFETARLINVYGIKVSVMNHKDLIAYKKLLNGLHQKEDIVALQNYSEMIRA